MVLEILISTMNRDNLSFLDKMFVNTNLHDYKILIINQTSEDKLLKSENEHVRVVNSFGYGLTKSRNLAIQHALGDICLIADDDVEYTKDFGDIIKQAFKNYTDASIIKFKIDTFCGNSYKSYPQQSKRLTTRKDIISASSIEIAFKRKAILKNNVSFNINFGLGSYFTSGEEYLFLKEALKKGLNIYFENKYVVKHALEHSTSNMGSDNFIKSQAAIYYLEHKNLSYLFLLKLIFFVLRRKYITIKDVKTKYYVGIEAIKACKGFQN